LQRNAGADIDTLEGKAAGTRGVLGERPDGFGTKTVWDTIECLYSECLYSDFSQMESDFARKGDQLSELRTNLMAMVSTMAETAESAAQKAVKDRLMGGKVHVAIKSSYQMAARFTMSGSLHPGDLLEAR
jgi:hypothetical protein